jgi:hypothetical protein
MRSLLFFIVVLNGCGQGYGDSALNYCWGYGDSALRVTVTVHLTIVGMTD